MTHNRKDVAKSAYVSLETGDFYLDGVRLPWWLARVDPQVFCDGVLELHLAFLVDGPVTIVSESGGKLKTYDPVLGDVSEWARKYVQEQLEQRLPWLAS